MQSIIPNTTADIFRTGKTPPSYGGGDAPDVTAVPCRLDAVGRSSLTTPDYTHIMTCGTKVDIRDAFVASSFSAGATCDTVYIPDSTFGTQYKVVLVRIVGLGTALAHKEVMLARQVPNWPTNNL